MGDELIRHHRLALFELVKNAYDADSAHVQITFYDVEDSENARIVILDSGEGMDLGTVKEIWLEPGADHRSKQRAAGKRTPIHGRLPVGEKGVGRFAAHKLGNHVEMVSRRAGQPEIVVEIDWTEVASHRYLKDAPIQIIERDPEVFVREATGTRIEISRLRQPWRRGEVRSLYRSMTAMTSPFATEDSFTPSVAIVPDPGWTEGMISPAELNKLAMFEFTFEFSDEGLEFEYTYDPLPGLEADYREYVTARKRKEAASRDNEYFRFEPKWKQRGRKRIPRASLPSLTDIGVGPISGRLLGFDRDNDLLRRFVLDRSGLEGYLNEQGGVRVYRDGLRVHDYGEQGNDWLGLGLRRVQNPTIRLSNNVLVGEVHLAIERSAGLVEKTNREGFVESDAFDEFRYAVLTALSEFENLRAVDKSIYRKAMEIEKTGTSARLSDGPVVAMKELQEKVLKEGLREQIGGAVDRVEKVYRTTHETLLSAVGAGLGLAMVFHELERGVRDISRVVSGEPPDVERARSMADHLVELLDGASHLVRATASGPTLASEIVKQVQYVYSTRLAYHKLQLVVDFDGGHEDFQIRGSMRMIVASLANILDNAVYWTEIRHPSASGEPKLIWMGASHDIEDGPAIVIADNGPGFSVDHDDAVQPFRTTKQDGMGLGLYFVSLAMKAHGGRVAFPRAEDVGVPSRFDGAVVALVFKGKRDAS